MCHAVILTLIFGIVACQARPRNPAFSITSHALPNLTVRGRPIYTPPPPLTIGYGVEASALIGHTHNEILVSAMHGQTVIFLFSEVMSFPSATQIVA